MNVNIKWYLSVLLVFFAVPAFSFENWGGTNQDNKLLDAAFRIDIDSIEAKLDYYPTQERIDGQATIRFQMRKRQSMPVIHLSEDILNGGIDQLVLNGQSLDPQGSDVRIVTFGDNPFPALELLQELSQDDFHELEITYHKHHQGLLYPEVDDTSGIGNEAFWPTINSNNEFARHHITFHIHGAEAHHFMGSGAVTTLSVNEGQAWSLDTQESVHSAAVFFLLIPESQGEVGTATIAGVPFEFIRHSDFEYTISDAVASLETWVPQLVEDFGPWPVPHGMKVFLVETGYGGMEFYGATWTNVWALRHEVTHQYFGAGMMMKTYRDGWLDEGFNIWYEAPLPFPITAIEADFVSDMVSAYTPLSAGFSLDGYITGARILEASAQAIGGRDALVEVVANLHETYRFKQGLDTRQFVKEMEKMTGVDLHESYLQWVFNHPSAKTAGIEMSHKTSATPFHGGALHIPYRYR